MHEQCRNPAGCKKPLGHHGSCDTLPSPSSYPPVIGPVIGRPHPDYFGKISFLGGDAPLPKPTRADLVLSAQQWATALREGAIDNIMTSRMLGMFDRLDATLSELARMP